MKIVGAAELEQTGVQDVVVRDYQSGADCGISDVTVFGVDASGRVVQRMHVENGCNLRTSVYTDMKAFTSITTCVLLPRTTRKR